MDWRQRGICLGGLHQRLARRACAPRAGQARPLGARLGSYRQYFGSRMPPRVPETPETSSSPIKRVVRSTPQVCVGPLDSCDSISNHEGALGPVLRGLAMHTEVVTVKGSSFVTQSTVSSSFRHETVVNNRSRPCRSARKHASAGNAAG